MAKEKEKKMLVGLSWNCAAELKFLITALLFVCSLATVLQFLPSSPFSLSSSRLQDCIPNLTTTTAISSNSTAASNQTSSTTNTTAIDGAVAPANLSLLSPPPLSPPTTPPPLQQDEVLEGGIIKRSFNPYGAASYNFVLMSAYRGGLNTFAVMGLSSKPLHVYGHPSYQCHWVPQNSSSPTAVAAAYKVLPDWGYGHVYTVVVVNCTFPSPVGHDGSGGKLLLLASTNGGGDTKSNVTDTILALTEKPETLDPNRFSSPPKYDYLYCGSSLYGQLSPQRIREWLAYHVRLFGERSHFVIHDAGGIHPDVMEVFKPWMEKGYVTMQDIKEQERFDGYYHNQFLIVNDCLHRYKFDAKWMFFFDVDEFIFVPRKSNLKAVMDSLSEYTQFTIEQMTMSNKLCLSDDMGVSHKGCEYALLYGKGIELSVEVANYWGLSDYHVAFPSGTPRK